MRGINLKALYRANNDFRDYVDKHCRQYKITVNEALEHAIVRAYAEHLTEEEKLCQK